MKIFVISDTHFSHKNIIKYSSRPFKTVEEMNETIIKNWNNKIGKEDLVIHLGDFALGSEEEIRNIKNKLNGTIILLKGNHDNTTTRRAGFLITDILEFENLIFTHFPLSRKEISKGFTNIHGHIHEKESLNGINISVEKTNYEPIELYELKKIVENKKNNKTITKI